MKIIKTYDWMRRDFSATLICESCENEQENTSCYDDSNYYNNVIPAIACKSCGESSNSLGLKKEMIAPKYNPAIVM